MPRLANAAPGLSPRVRGNPRPRAGTGCGNGSIPACAGEPHPAVATAGRGRRWRRVYPRVCGGTQTGKYFAILDVGLSPRVRGNLGAPEGLSSQQGSIPACAGEPHPTAPSPRASTVYPRVCGGTSSSAMALRRPGGLSPRVRGNPLPGHGKGRGDRSIPACAGEPAHRRWRCAGPGVYPRVCGGTGMGSSGILSSGGLSPRVRGNPTRLMVAGTSARSIPACAGEPGGHGSSCY